jgi:hypothetical protein
MHRLHGGPPKSTSLVLTEDVSLDRGRQRGRNESAASRIHSLKGELSIAADGPLVVRLPQHLSRTVPR